MKNRSRVALFASSLPWLAPGALSLVVACSGAKTTGEGPHEGPEPESMPLEVTDAKAEYYRQAFPQAASFVGRRIPKSLIKTANKGNDVYVEVQDENGDVVGYLRDFLGPVTTNEACECSPIQVTLAFDAERSFQTLIAPGPIYKWGEQPMSDDEIERLIDIVKSPHPSLLDASTPDALIDIKSGATQKEYRDHVVERAALTSQRLAKLAEDTATVLARAPLKRDQQRLEELMAQDNTQDIAYLETVARFVRDAESEELRGEAYRQLARAYPSVAGKTPSTLVEEVLLNATVDRELRVQACYLLAEDGLRNSTTEDCASRSSATSDQPLEARLAGTVAFNAGDYADALRTLEPAAMAISHLVDPGLHYRLGKAARESGDDILACSVGKRLYQDAPLYPGAPELLESCEYRRGVAVLKKEIEAVRRQRVLNGEHPSEQKVPTLNLETDQFEPVETNLAKDGMITVAVFFATWCPHCQRELPKLVEFEKSLEQDPALKDAVRVVAVRTLIERETEDYAKWKERMGVSFPIYTDPAMGTAFAAFARSQGVERPGVPLVALVDESADVRFILNSYEYSDTAKELRWLIDKIQR